MSIKFNYFLLLVVISFSVFAQQKTTITGTVSCDKLLLPDALIELQINGTSKFSISNKNGAYTFSNINILPADSLFIKVNYQGYAPYIEKLKALKNNTVFDINLTIAQPETLNEVVIKGSDKIINSARKSSYGINGKDFIKNAKATQVLATIPNVYIDSKGGNITVDGTLSPSLFIDGIEMMNGELKTIDATNIDRVEVINNPSGIYGTDTEAVINIITKPKTDDYIKGIINASGGARNNYWIVEPELSYKRGRFIIKSDFEYKPNNQKVNSGLVRNSNGTPFFQDNINNSTGNQKYFDTRINVKLSEKSNLTITNSYTVYNFFTNAKGFSGSNDENFIYYTKKGLSNTIILDLGSVYRYKINEDKKLYFKAKYLTSENKDHNLFNYSDTTSLYYNLQSKSKAFTGTVDYEAENLSVLKKETGFYSGVKFINRDFTFSGTDFYVNQNIVNCYAELDTKWSKEFSTDINFAFENTKNSNTITLLQEYNFLLPTLNALYHFKNKLDAKLGYSRRILRPSASDLNDALLILNPGLAKQGNSNLNPQIKNNYFFSINKAIGKNNFSLKFYTESVSNLIVDTYRMQNDLLIQTLDNAAKYNATGMNLGVRTKLLKKINVNLNSGFDYSTFEDNSPVAVIKKNNGYTFRGNMSLSTNLFKDKLSVSFSGSQKGPNYSLLSKTVTHPYFDFNIATNLFKDRINVSLYGQNIFGLSSNFNQISSYNNFYQNVSVRNNTSNLVLTIAYNFGKKFDDHIDDNSIENNDIRK